MQKQSEMKIRYAPEKLQVLTEKAERAGLSREEYCRRILDGATVKEAPDADTKTLIREVRQAGYSLNGILKKANTVGFIDAPELKKALSEIQSAARHIIEAYSERRH